MRTVHSKHPLPTNWSGLHHARKALLIADVYVTEESRLRLKLLVFKTRKDMRLFHKHALRRDTGLGTQTLGCVCSLQTEHHFVPGKNQKPRKPYLEVDPRYFAVMLLTQRNLCMEIITHEAVHAAYSFAERSKMRWPDDDNPEEKICYPAGRIAKRINALIHDNNLYL